MESTKSVNFNKIKLYIPDAVTIIRVVSACVMLFFSAFSVSFYVCFSICVVSDVLDGVLARALKAQTKQGEKLDTFADFVFFIFTVCVLAEKVFFPDWIIIVALAVFCVKISILLFKKIKGSATVIPHNAVNKAAGVCLTVCVYLIPHVNNAALFSICAAVTVLSAVCDVASVVRRGSTGN